MSDIQPHVIIGTVLGTGIMINLLQSLKNYVQSDQHQINKTLSVDSPNVLKIQKLETNIKTLTEQRNKLKLESKSKPLVQLFDVLPKEYHKTHELYRQRIGSLIEITLVDTLSKIEYQTYEFEIKKNNPNAIFKNTLFAVWATDIPDKLLNLGPVTPSSAMHPELDNKYNPRTTCSSTYRSNITKKMNPEVFGRESQEQIFKKYCQNINQTKFDGIFEFTKDQAENLYLDNCSISKDYISEVVKSIAISSFIKHEI